MQQVIVSSDKSECREVGAGQHLVSDPCRPKLHSIIAAQPVMLRSADSPFDDETLYGYQWVCAVARP